MSGFDTVTRWLALKKYQIEVTFSVYIFTAAEKAIFWSVVFLFTALTLIATILYMPQHISFLLSRTWFYFIGDDDVDVLEMTKDAIMGEFAGGVGSEAEDASTAVAEALLKGTAAAAAAALVGQRREL